MSEEIKIGSIEKDEIFFNSFDERWPKFKWMLDNNDVIIIEEMRKDKNKSQMINYLSICWLTKISGNIDIQNQQSGIFDIIYVIGME